MHTVMPNAYDQVNAIRIESADIGMRMEEMNERLRQARVGAGIGSVQEAADRLGIKYPTYAAHENGSRSFGRDAAQRYARVFGVSVEWLLYGSGDVKRVENGEPTPDTAALVPVYDIDASAGGGAVVDGEDQAYSLAFPPFYLRKIAGGSVNELAIIGVKGDSMEPTLPDDSIVLVDQGKRNLGYDGLFVLQIDDVLHVKRVGRGTRSGHIMIISDNKDVHPAFERAIDEVHAVGKVLWYGRKV